MEQVLYGIDYIEYYFYWIYYKFIGYPLIIRICSIAVMFCIIAYLFLLFHIIYGIFKRRKEKRKYNKAFDKYYEEMKSISLDSNTLSEEEIADRLEYDTKKRPKPNELRIITQLLTEIKSVHEDEINELNYQTIQTVFQITRFLERELQFGSKRSKIQALKLIQSINGYASEAVLVRFLYHRELELRNSARYTYMWLSQGDPFRFFDEDIGMKLRQWDMTGLYNKNILLSLVEDKSYDYQDIAVFYWDVNKLKYVNDNYGHLSGDRLIMKVAESILKVAKEDCVAFRYGGDEFLMIIRQGTEKRAEELIEIWKKELENLSVDCDFPVSASVGYAIGKKECLKDVIAIADHNMYLCKQKAHNERV